MFLSKAEKIKWVEELKSAPDRVINILRMANPELISWYLTNSKEISYIVNDLQKSEFSKLIDDGMLDKFNKL